MKAKTKQNQIIQKQRQLQTAISKDVLTDKLLELEKYGATFCKVKSITEPKMNKRNNPFYGNILKKSELVGLICFDYENNVNNARVKETLTYAKNAGIENTLIQKLLNELSEKELKEKAKEETQKFEQKERKWGQHAFNPHTNKSSRIIIEHTNKKGDYNRYFQIRVLQTKEPVYMYKDNKKVLSENELNELKQFFPKRRRNKRQGLNEENEIIIRDYKIENITHIKLNKNEYMVY
ncbi:MAG: hypothetical protein ACOCP8_05110 [archaeon]